MNPALPGLHAILAGAWIGCVLVEALFERALLGQGRDKELLLARLHWKVDKWVELPLLIAVVVTGAKVLRGVEMDTMLRAKLACAALAIFANLYCIVLVRIRLRMAEAGQWALFEMVDRRQHLFGAVVLIGLLGAAGLALWP